MTWNGPPNRHNVIPFEGSQEAYLTETIEVLENAVEEDDGDTLFLWTGGKEANVIADLLLYEIGDIQGVSPIPFGTIQTGNEFDEMLEFREHYLASTGDRGAETVGPKTGIGDVHTREHTSMLKHIIYNPCDPRGYHGEHTGEWLCEECQEPAERNEHSIVCDNCGSTTELHDVQKTNMKPDEWGVPESCGALKVIPLKRFIEDDGYTTLITGVRSTDPIVTTETDDVEHVVERNEPVPHTRINPLANWKTSNVWAYINAENVSIPVLYEDGYEHTDSKCCTDADTKQVGEYGEGGRDPEKDRAIDRLEAMGYV